MIENIEEKKAAAHKAGKRKKRKKHPVLRGIFKGIGIFLLLIVCGATFTLCCAAGAIRGAISTAPSVDTIDISPTGYATYVYDSAGTQIEELVSSGSNRVYVTLDEIPVSLQHAFVAIEDERFYEHNGVDPQGIVRAFVQGIKTGSFSQGASTITQQLLKNNVFTDWTSETSFGERLRRKIQEQYLAVSLEEITDKDTIIENYLNTINLGQGCYGVEAAALRYFDKDVSELNLSEASVIAGITQNPTKYNPISHPDRNAERRTRVLNKMLELEYITQSEYNEAMEDDVYARIQEVDETKETSIYSYFVDSLIDEVVADLMEVKGYSEQQAYKLLYSGGLSIYTTQDPDIQQICDEEYQNEENFPDAGYSFSLSFAVQHSDGSVNWYDEQSMLTYLKENVSSKSYLIYDSQEEARAAIDAYEQVVLDLGKSGDEIVEGTESVIYTPQPQASIVIMDQATGQVKALVGGRGKKEASLTLNRATDTARQPGSTFKVLSTYAPAIDTGMFTLASTQDNSPYYYADGTQVHNYDNSYTGWTSLRTAITKSINVVTVKTLTDLTPQVGYDYLLDFGFTTLQDSDIVQSLALGGITKGVSNLELTAAFATIANGGTYTEPVYYTKILDYKGNVLIDKTPDTHRVLSEQSAWLLTSAMEDVVTKGTGTAVDFGTTAIAGKTGTTTSNVDSWFVGYTTGYTCGVWGGCDTNEPMDTTTFTKALWKAVMGRIHEDLPYEEFVQPDGIVTKTVCRVSGLLPADACSGDTFTEFFAANNVPEEYCTLHQSYDICEESGLLATEYCPNVIKQGYMSGGAPTEKCDIHDADSQEDEDIEDEENELETQVPDTAVPDTTVPDADVEGEQ